MKKVFFTLIFVVVLYNILLLNNGDIVELFTSKTGTPKLHWLKFCVTKQAQSRIRQWFKKHNREENISISQFTLKEVVRQTIFSISDNENNKLMTGELFEINNDELKVVSLDGHRISIRKIRLKNS